MRLLRAHGLMTKVARTRRHVLGDKGRAACRAILAARRADTTTLVQAAQENLRGPRSGLPLALRMTRINADQNEGSRDCLRSSANTLRRNSAFWPKFRSKPTSTW